MQGTFFVILAFLSGGTLLLKSGERIPIVGTPSQQGQSVIFRSGSGSLFSLPLAEVDLEGTAHESAISAVRPSPSAIPIALKAPPEERRRLIAELEQNHAGTSPPPQSKLAPLLEPERNSEDEWSWRHRADEQREAIVQARENLALLTSRAEELRAHITSLLSLGYKSSQFTYDSTTLQNTLDQIPAAQVEVTRAERSYDRFRDEARQRGIMPGWVR